MLTKITKEIKFFKHHQSSLNEGEHIIGEVDTIEENEPVVIRNGYDSRGNTFKHAILCHKVTEVLPGNRFISAFGAYKFEIMS